MLWNYLKRKQMKGYNFHRQKPIDNYIVDFFDSELMLAIEVNGESHYGNEMRDARRKKKIASYGIEFLRFDDLDIVINLIWW